MRFRFVVFYSNLAVAIEALVVLRGPLSIELENEVSMASMFVGNKERNANLFAARFMEAICLLKLFLPIKPYLLKLLICIRYFI